MTSIRGILRIGLAALVGVAVPVAETQGHANKLQVKQLEAAYRLEPGSLSVRVTLVGGEALEFEAKDADSIQTILKMAEILGGQRGRLFAEVEARTVKALQVAVP